MMFSENTKPLVSLPKHLTEVKASTATAIISGDSSFSLELCVYKKAEIEQQSWLFQTHVTWGRPGRKGMVQAVMQHRLEYA